MTDTVLCSHVPATSDSYRKNIHCQLSTNTWWKRTLSSGYIHMSRSCAHISWNRYPRSPVITFALHIVSTTLTLFQGVYTPCPSSAILFNLRGTTLHISRDFILPTLGLIQCTSLNLGTSQLDKEGRETDLFSCQCLLGSFGGHYGDRRPS